MNTWDQQREEFIEKMEDWYNYQTWNVIADHIRKYFPAPPPPPEGQLYYFHEVKAGEPFPFETDYYVWKSRLGPNCGLFRDGEKYSSDFHILRPAPLPGKLPVSRESDWIEYAKDNGWKWNAKEQVWEKNNAGTTNWGIMELHRLHLASLATVQPSGGTRWVKASEQLPKMGAVIFRINGINAVGSFHKKGELPQMVTDRFYSRASKEYYFPPFPTIEWLDESATPPVTGYTEEQVREVAERLFNFAGLPSERKQHLDEIIESLKNTKK